MDRVLSLFAYAMAFGDKTWPCDTEAAAEPVKYPPGSIPPTGGEAGKAADVAERALFLVSERAVGISGMPVWIDGARPRVV